MVYELLHLWDGIQNGKKCLTWLRPLYSATFSGLHKENPAQNEFRQGERFVVVYCVLLRWGVESPLHVVHLADCFLRFVNGGGGHGVGG